MIKKLKCSYNKSFLPVGLKLWIFLKSFHSYQLKMLLVTVLHLRSTYTFDVDLSNNKNYNKTKTTDGHKSLGNCGVTILQMWLKTDLMSTEK